MEYFFYGRDRPGVAGLRRATMEAHWSFIDGYADALIARGPTLADDDDAFTTGSMHIVDLPDRRAVEVFAYEEPFFKAGVFGDLLIRRWSNTLQRTMWDFVGSGGQRFLVLGHGQPDRAQPLAEFSIEQSEFLGRADCRDALIAYGPLLSEDGESWVGDAMPMCSPPSSETGVLSPRACEPLHPILEEDPELNDSESSMVAW